MNSRPTLASALCFATGLFALAAGCSPSSADGQSAKAEPETTDEPKAAPRIASVTVFSDEVLHALGPQTRERVVAVSTMADDPQYSSVVDQWPKSLPRVAGVTEQIVATNPDVVILASFTQAETRAAVKAAGIDVVVIEGFNGFDDYRDNVKQVAKAAGDPEAAQQLLETFDARRQEIADEVAAAKLDQVDPRTVISWNDGSVPGAHTTFDDAATLAGLKNVAAQNGRDGHTRVSAEQLVTWAPDWIVVACASPGDDAACDQARDAAKADPVLAATAAGRNDRIMALPPRELYDVGAGMLDLADSLRENIARE